MTDEREHRRTPPANATEERTADQSTQEAGGLHERLRGVRPGPGPELAHEEEADDVLNRSVDARYDTPRRHEQEEDAALLPTTPTLSTKI